jgi:hypothetical protein
MARVSKRLKWGGLAAVVLVVVFVALPRAKKAAAPAEAPVASASAASAPAAAVSTVPPSPDGIALASPRAGAVRVPSSPQAWGGPRTGSEPTLSDRVVAYRISARLDPDKHTIEGRQQLTWRNRSAVPVRAVYLHLYLNAFAGQGSTFMTEKRTLGFGFRSDIATKDGDWGRIDLTRVEQQGARVPWHFVQPDGGPATDRTVVRLDLPRAVPPGASTTLDIDFFDQLPRVVARTGHVGTFHLVGQWFPKIAVLELPGERGATAPRWNAHEMHLHSEFYADYGSYDVRIDVPEGVTVGATGTLAEPPVVANGRVLHRYTQDDVHDFAWTADKRTAKPLEATWRNPAIPGSPDVQVRVLFPPEYASNAQPVLQATLDSLTYFSRTLGPYPYRSVTAVIPPFNAGEAGGMEYPTFFTASAYRNLQPRTLASYGLDFVTIHEFGHGYFYGILGSNEFEEPFLDEGLNEFWNLRMVRERRQRIDLTTPWLRRLGVAPSIDAFDAERLGASLRDPADGLGRNSWDRLSTASYGSVYARTATAMRDFETRIGREALEKAFQAYYARWKFRHPSTADLRDALAESTGKPEVVDALFAQHVVAATPVDDRIESFKSEEELPQTGGQLVDGRWTVVTEEQNGERIAAARKAWRKAHPNAKPDDPGPFPYRTTVTLRRKGLAQAQTLVVKFADRTSETVTWNDGERWARYSWVKPAKATAAQLDPEGLYAMDGSLLDNGRLIQADRRAARRVVTDASLLWQSLLALVATL